MTTTKRVKSVVVIPATGGSDYLNTVVPYTNALYYDSCPVVNIPAYWVLPSPARPELVEGPLFRIFHGSTGSPRAVLRGDVNRLTRAKDCGARGVTFDLINYLEKWFDKS